MPQGNSIDADGMVGLDILDGNLGPVRLGLFEALEELVVGVGRGQARTVPSS